MTFPTCRGILSAGESLDHSGPSKARRGIPAAEAKDSAPLIRQHAGRIAGKGIGP